MQAEHAERMLAELVGAIDADSKHKKDLLAICHTNGNGATTHPNECSTKQASKAARHNI